MFVRHSCSHILSHWLRGDKVDYGIELSYWPASLCFLASLCQCRLYPPSQRLRMGLRSHSFLTNRWGGFIYVDLFSGCKDQIIIETIYFSLAKVLSLYINLQISRNTLYIPSCWCKSYQVNQRVLNTRGLGGPRSSSFWFRRNLSHHMIRQARSRDTVLVKSREMTLPKHYRGGGLGERGKDDRKQKYIGPALRYSKWCPVASKLMKKTEIQKAD